VCDPRQQTVQDLWANISEIPSFGESKAKLSTVAAQPVVLKALAKICFDLNFSNRKPENGEILFRQFLDDLPEIDWSHGNPMWRYYHLTDEQRQEYGLTGLRFYLPSEDGGNRDIGLFQEGVMRFGAKHNDIFPILADMIRWKLSLPNRHDKK
jgi:hypothetical protein